VAKVTKDYGKATAQCNRGVNAVFKEVNVSGKQIIRKPIITGVKI